MCERSLILPPCSFAVKGNEMANQGNYPAAVDLFTEAINLDAKDFRFVVLQGRRSLNLLTVANLLY